VYYPRLGLRLGREFKFLFLLLLALGWLMSAAADEGEVTAPGPATYSGKMMDVMGSGLSTPKDLLVRIFHYCSAEEMQQYEEMLSHKGGQKELVEAIHKHEEMGQFRVGTDLTYSIRLITWQATGKGRRILLVGNRYTLPSADLRARDPRDYPFIVISLDIDAKDNGKGSHFEAARLRFNKKHQLEVEDYLAQPSTIVSLKRETHYN